MVQHRKKPVESPGNICGSAARMLERTGWVQNDWSTPSGNCLVAALNRAIDPHRQASDDLPGRVVGPLHKSLLARSATYREHFLGQPAQPRMRDVLYNWNDLPTTTMDDVIDALKGVAKDQKAAAKAAKLHSKTRGRNARTPQIHDLDLELLLLTEAVAADAKELVTA